MKGKAKTYLIIGIVILVIGIIMLVTGAVSRTIAYGDFVLAFVFLALSTRENKKADDDNKDK
jgi:hypothetical protein